MPVGSKGVDVLWRVLDLVFACVGVDLQLYKVLFGLVGGAVAVLSAMQCYLVCCLKCSAVLLALPVEARSLV